MSLPKGLRWNETKRDNAVKKNSFVSVREFRRDDKGNRFPLKDENGNVMKGDSGETLYEEVNGTSTRTLTGIPRHYSNNVNSKDIYIADPYWITGTLDEVKRALSGAGVTKPDVEDAINDAITSKNWRNYPWEDDKGNRMGLEDFLEQTKKTTTRRKRVEPAISGADLAMMASIVKTRSTIVESDTPLETINAQGKVSVRSSTSPRGRGPTTPQGLWKKANDCLAKRGQIPVRLANGKLELKDSHAALNISKMTADGKGVKGCYAPRDSGARSPRSRPRKLVHVVGDLGEKGSANIVVNVENSGALDNYLKYMMQGNVLNQKEAELIKAEFNQHKRGFPSVKSPKKGGKSQRRSPSKRASGESASKGKKIVTTKPRMGATRNVEKELNELESQSASVSSEEPSEESPKRVSEVQASRSEVKQQRPPTSGNVPARVGGKRVGGLGSLVSK